MTTTTTAHADWAGHSVETPARGIALASSATTPRRAGAPVDPGLLERMERLADGVPTVGDPSARARIASVLYRLTGWDVFTEDVAAAGVAHIPGDLTEDELGDEFAAFSDEARDWADHTSAAVAESWPDA